MFHDIVVDVLVQEVTVQRAWPEAGPLLLPLMIGIMPVVARDVG